MGGPVDALELAAIDDVLRRQWLRLRRWVGDLGPAELRAPSVLPGWDVSQLVAHLGRAMGALAGSQPAGPGVSPQSLGEYLGRYAEGAAGIDQRTRDLAAQIAADPLGGLDELAEDAFAQLGVLRGLGADPVVIARRGPIHLSDMLVSRLVELVVHGDDLVRSTGRAARGDQNPVDDQALHLVADALLEVVVDRGGWDLEVVEPLGWVRLATGRVPYDTDALTAALQARHTSDSVPDLGTLLPLL